MNKAIKSVFLMYLFWVHLKHTKIETSSDCEELFLGEASFIKFYNNAIYILKNAKYPI